MLSTIDFLQNILSVKKPTTKMMRLSRPEDNVLMSKNFTLDTFLIKPFANILMFRLFTKWI